jgi:2-dehydro-3-deoxyphosphooctonate aldolase (KDO 8-P synthase)
MHKFTALKKPVSAQIAGKTITWGAGDQFVLFAGPDIVEDEGLVTEVAQELKKITAELGIPWILKCSYDKANRQSAKNFRGPGMKNALDTLARVKAKAGCGLLSDIHETIQVEPAAEVIDVLQIPAFLSRQTDLLVEAARTGKVLHIKKGQFLAPWDMGAITQKAVDAGNDKLLLCDRGTSFGYNRLINDMAGLVEMRKFGFPTIMDITHSTQLPGAKGDSSGAQTGMAPVLGRAALAVGVDGVFLECHPNPDKALCDGPTSIALGEVKEILQSFQRIWNTHKE